MAKTGKRGATKAATNKSAIIRMSLAKMKDAKVSEVVDHVKATHGIVVTPQLVANVKQRIKSNGNGNGHRQARQAKVQFRPLPASLSVEAQPTRQGLLISGAISHAKSLIGHVGDPATAKEVIDAVSNA